MPSTATGAAAKIFPRKRGPFIREADGGGREIVAGHSADNAQAEELAAKATFKQPGGRGQRCIIPT